MWLFYTIQIQFFMNNFYSIFTNLKISKFSAQTVNSCGVENITFLYRKEKKSFMLRPIDPTQTIDTK